MGISMMSLEENFV